MFKGSKVVILDKSNDKRSELYTNQTINQTQNRGLCLNTPPQRTNDCALKKKKGLEKERERERENITKRDGDE